MMQAGNLGSQGKPNPSKRANQTIFQNNNTVEKIGENKPKPNLSPKSPEPRATNIFSGILTLGKPVEIHKSAEKPKAAWSSEFIPTQSLATQEKVLYNQEQQQVLQELNSLRRDIQELISTAREAITPEIAATVSGNVEKPTIYHLNFFSKVRNLIQDLRRNIQDAQEWLSMGKNKKQKKNFWSTYKDRKHGGGEQFLNSSESSATRAVA